MKRFWIGTLALVAIAGLAAAQAAPQQPAQGQAQAPAAGKKQPQAKTRPEFDLYQKFWNSQDPDERIKSADEFLKQFPESELKVYALMASMQGYQMKNDFNKLREFGERILDIDANDVPTLITLATAIPERTTENDLDKDQKRTAAENYAKRALEAIDKLEKPPAITDPQWEATRNDAKSQAHYALGLVNLQRKSYPAAVDELTLASKLQAPSQPDPILYWRLGLAHELNKKYDEAIKAYDKSISLGGVKISGKDQAVEDRDRLKKLLEKKP